MTQKGKSSFTNDEVKKIEELLEKIRSSKRKKQLFLRNQLRGLGFYIINYCSSRNGFTVEDFRKLVRDGSISIDNDLQS